VHESSLINGLIRQVETVARQNNARSVQAVKVRLGALSQISADHFREHFVQASAGTMAQDARLDIDESSDLHDPHACEILIESVEVTE